MYFLLFGVLWLIKLKRVYFTSNSSIFGRARNSPIFYFIRTFLPFSAEVVPMENSFPWCIWCRYKRCCANSHAYIRHIDTLWYSNITWHLVTADWQAAKTNASYLFVESLACAYSNAFQYKGTTDIKNCRVTSLVCSVACRIHSC